MLVRDAVKDDAPALAPFHRIAAAGVVEFLFEGLVPGVTPDELITGFIAETGNISSSENCMLAEQDGAIVGMFTAYPAEEHRVTPEIESFLPPERLDPLREFFNSRVEDSYYIDTFAVSEKYRRQGIGTALLNGAKDRGRKAGFESICLIALAANTGGRAFYERNGFREVRPVPLGPMPGVAYEEGALLMKAPL
ncbi:MAG: GNAT family N-acetyltransferase [Rhodospirillales bacterium]|nr:GNAT family N-acetyltransferase [Rhodospirillales bacterium]